MTFSLFKKVYSVKKKKKKDKEMEMDAAQGICDENNNTYTDDYYIIL